MSFIPRAVLLLTAAGLLQASSAAQAPPQYAPAQLFALGSHPSDVAIGDLNGDGRPDIVTTSYGSDDVSVLLGTGAGGFGPATTFGVGNGPLALAIGDLNDDGHLDVVTANVGSKDVSLLLGNGDGSFAPHTDWDVSGGSYGRPKSIQLADMDGDGHLDVVTGTDYVDVVGLPGTGTGGFGPRKLIGVNEAPEMVAVADLNGDGILDIAAPDGGSDKLYVLLGNGAWGFSANVFVVGEYVFHAVATGDVDGDGDLDVFTGHSDLGFRGVYMLLGTGTGSFGTAASIYDEEVTDMVVDDVNGDGALDLVAVGAAASVDVQLGTGTGSFGAVTSLAVGPGAAGVAIGDLNGDGAVDIVATSSFAVSVLLNTDVPPPPAPWTAVGPGLPGTGNQMPLLTGTGPLTPNSGTHFDLSNAKAGSAASLVAGLTRLDAPFKGGVLVPKPDFLLSPLPVSASGTSSVSFHWPATAPAGVKLYVQYWVADAGGPYGFSASNGLQLIGQ